MSFILFSDHSSRCIDTDQLDFFLCICNDVQCILRNLLRYSVNLLGDLSLFAITNSLARHSIDGGDWRSSQVSLTKRISTKLSFTEQISNLIVFFFFNFAKRFLSFHIFFHSFLVQITRTMFCPDDIDCELLQNRKEKQANSDLLVTWSRSTSASSIYRLVLFCFFFRIVF